MNSKIRKLLSAREWRLDLVRPFSLFGASLWHHWYSSSEAVKCLGVETPDALFLEEQKNIFRYYKDIGQMKRLNLSAKKVILNKTKTLRLLKDAEQLNKKARALLKGSAHILDVAEMIDFFTNLGLKAGALPNRIQHFSQSDLKKVDAKVLRLALRLRSQSYYPQILEDVLNPLVVDYLRSKLGNIADRVIDVITYEELVESNFGPANKRLKAGPGSLFVYAVIKGQETVLQTKDVKQIISVVEPYDLSAVIKGTVAYPGKVSGVVRIVNARKIEGVRFRKGEILVSISTSPTYLPIMKKASAIVVDEGGMTSHAAILSRELEKPCIMGTKIATRALKDGDRVEVDANCGIVRKISN
ncbi:MAG TPA: PEP-utilizing enzyme [Patescibacteria group bacterium]|nr:PEP-utilizing enzyme [Patescibacteria group bacterium]